MPISDPSDAMRRAAALAETTALIAEIMEAFPDGPVREAVSRVLRNGGLDERCWSCEHKNKFHQPDGCWFTVSRGRVDAVLNCQCGVTVEATDQALTGSRPNAGGAA